MKAQFWSFDVIFAMIIFGSALILLTFVWVNISGQYSTAYGLGLQTMQAQLQSLQGRVLTRGTPQNWNSAINVTNTLTWSNVSIGLGTGSGSQLSPGKIAALAAMSNYNTLTYESTKQLLGVGYDWYIAINSSNSTLAMGLYPYTRNPYAIQVARQSAVLNGVPVSVLIIIWTNKSFGVG
ncbi:MAG: hypothetical protein KGI04_01020 [Candidatus Micrarchaeota archaeon]|nr:hypothetical protein [Candidatus Micrarchaeota archaeon]